MLAPAGGQAFIPGCMLVPAGGHIFIPGCILVPVCGGVPGIILGIAGYIYKGKFLSMFSLPIGGFCAGFTYGGSS